MGKFHHNKVDLNHIVHIFVLDFKSWPLWVGFTILLALSFIFEIIENAQCTIQKYRESSGISGDYDGDSYQNIIADLIVVSSWLYDFMVISFFGCWLDERIMDPNC